MSLDSQSIQEPVSSMTNNKIVIKITRLPLSQVESHQVNNKLENTSDSQAKKQLNDEATSHSDNTHIIENECKKVYEQDCFILADTKSDTIVIHYQMKNYIIFKR